MIKLTKNLIFKPIVILICLIGCLYEIGEVVRVYLELETKVELSLDSQSQIVIPNVRICKPRIESYRDQDKKIDESPATIYNKTYHLSEIFLFCSFRINNRILVDYRNCKFEGASNHTIQMPHPKHTILIPHPKHTILMPLNFHFEKTVNSHFVCYNFKHHQFSQNEARIEGPIYG